jgi:hypothetical protein
MRSAWRRSTASNKRRRRDGDLSRRHRRPTEAKKQEDTDTNMETITKSDVGMHAFCKGIVDRGIAYPHWEFDTKVLVPYARNKFPTLHPGNAIAKVLAEEPPVAAAYSAVHSAYHPAYAVAKAAVADDDEADDEGDGTDPLRLIERLAAALRQKRPELSKAAAFAAIYTDPQYAPLAKRERARYRPRA